MAGGISPLPQYQVMVVPQMSCETGSMLRPLGFTQDNVLLKENLSGQARV